MSTFERHNYPEDKPIEYKLYLVWIDTTIGGNNRFHLAQYSKKDYPEGIFVCRDGHYGDQALFDNAVVFWWELPQPE